MQVQQPVDVVLLAQGLQAQAWIWASRLQDAVKELSLRTLIQVTKIRQSAGKNWANLAEYTICG